MNEAEDDAQEGVGLEWNSPDNKRTTALGLSCQGEEPKPNRKLPRLPVLTPRLFISAKLLLWNTRTESSRQGILEGGNLHDI